MPNISGPQIVARAPLVTLDGLIEGSNCSNEQLRPKRTSRGLTLETIAEIAAAHTTYNGNVTKVARAVGVSRSSVKKYWLRDGLRANTIVESLGPRQDDIEKILRAHFIHRGNAAEAARHLLYSSGTIRKYWRRNGFRVMRKSEALRLSEEERGRIVAIHAEVNGNSSAASRVLHYSDGTVIKYWREAGLPLRKPGVHRTLTGEQIEEIVAAYEPCGGIVSQAARLLSHSIVTITKYWRAYGLYPAVRGLNRKLTQS